ncbi:hypothetical protein [Thioalkalivibrio sp. HK1]|nr:hypothetical protein [Thioalkalivibrio sp. HK1]
MIKNTRTVAEKIPGHPSAQVRGFEETKADGTLHARFHRALKIRFDTASI